MSERLTDEHLERIAALVIPGQDLYIAQMATELLALRAENDKFKWQVGDTCARAEKAEARIDAYKHASLEREAEVDTLRAERAKLEGELGYVRTWIASSVDHHQSRSMVARIDRVLAGGEGPISTQSPLAQPAESGATERPFGVDPPKRTAAEQSVFDAGVAVRRNAALADVKIIRRGNHIGDSRMLDDMYGGADD